MRSRPVWARNSATCSIASDSIGSPAARSATKHALDAVVSGGSTPASGISDSATITVGCDRVSGAAVISSTSAAAPSRSPHCNAVIARTSMSRWKR